MIKLSLLILFFCQILSELQCLCALRFSVFFLVMFSVYNGKAYNSIPNYGPVSSRSTVVWCQMTSYEPALAHDDVGRPGLKISSSSHSGQMGRPALALKTSATGTFDQFFNPIFRSLSVYSVATPSIVVPYHLETCGGGDDCPWDWPLDSSHEWHHESCDQHGFRPLRPPLRLRGKKIRRRIWLSQSKT